MKRRPGKGPGHDRERPCQRPHPEEPDAREGWFRASPFFARSQIGFGETRRVRGCKPVGFRNIARFCTSVNPRFSLSSAKEAKGATVAGNTLFASSGSRRSGRRRAAALVEPVDKRQELAGAVRRSPAEADPLSWGSDPTRRGASGASEHRNPAGTAGPAGPQRERCGAHSVAVRTHRAGSGVL